MRVRLAQSLSVSDKNAFALLQAVGGDCAGALALYPTGEQPPPVNTNDIETLDDTRLAEILALRQTNNTIENALLLKKTLEAKGLRSPVFADICKVIEERAGRIQNHLAKE